MKIWWPQVSNRKR